MIPLRVRGIREPPGGHIAQDCHRVTARDSIVPSAARAIFESLCADVPPYELLELRERVKAHVDDLRSAARHNRLLAVDIAETLATALVALLADASNLPPPHRRLVVGAARYFCSSEDAIRDTASPLGLDDDVSVFNHVARA